MIRYLLAIGAFLGVVALEPVAAQTPALAPLWDDGDRASLRRWQEAARAEGADRCPEQAGLEVTAIDSADPLLASGAARRSALALARWFALGCTEAKQRDSWRISDKSDGEGLDGVLDEAIAQDSLDALFERLRPDHPHYQALVSAKSGIDDPAMRQRLALNLDRWRWMPRRMGDRYLLVNVPAYTATLWENGRAVRQWPVIVGKTSTPTPVFEALVSGVIYNPWWNIPTSIVAESVGSLVRNRPAEARQRGYVVENGRYRQRPGPQNALGQMKLVMPNPFSVYLHDTPAKQLFEQDTRAFSHGCIRVGGALDLAQTLIGDALRPVDIETILEGGETTSVGVSSPLPVYVVYFTMEPDAQNGVIEHKDIYKRDARALALRAQRRALAALASECSASRGG